jgi:hypothetical protein
MMQKQIFSVLPHQAETLELLPMALIEQAKSDSQALTMSVSLSNGTHESLSNEIGIPRETLTRFLNGNGGLNYTNFKKLINATGNLVLIQDLAHTFGYELKAIDVKAKRKAELLAELAEIERAA